MATVTEKPESKTPPPDLPSGGQQLVDQHIRQTRRALKLVDFTAGLIALAIGVLAYLLTMAVLEHWVVSGGWSDSARTLLFGILLVGIAIYSWRTFWPLLHQPINPAYAAKTIEENSPSLKNSLLNLLLLRNRKQQMPQQVYQAIEQQAAQGLTSVRMDSVVDRSVIVRLGYILVALTAIAALYRFLSPKDLITSAGRVLMPWSDLATPSRVEILDVKPGDTKVARGEQLQVSAEVLGLEEDEVVRLFYSTADEQIVGQEIRMKPSAGGTQFSCKVPGRVGIGSSGGIQQDFSYWLEAGDARSPRYQVAVFARPTMVVNRLRYEYPTYTGFPTREVEHTGDIQAVEGTKVTLYAQANKPIQEAHIDFDADGRRDLLMNSTEQQATATFPLELRDDRRTPRYQSYVLRYETTAGNQNRDPAKYQIDVQPDYSPEIQLLLPEEAVLEVALNQEVNFELEARDPDFALSRVMLIGKVGDDGRVQEDLLTPDNISRGHTGRFVGKLNKTPEQMGLKVGDVLEYWGAAADNRRPEANLAYSAHRKIRVIGPWQPNQNDQADNGEGEQQPGEGGEQSEGEGNQDGQTGAGEPGDSGEGEQGEQGEGGSGQESGEQSESGDQQGQGNSASGDGQQNNDSKAQGNADGQSSGENSDNSDSQGEPGESSNGSSEDGGGEQGKVSSEGDDDGSAFEKMAEHFENQDGKSGEGANQADEQESGKADQAESNDNAADGSPDSNQSGEPGESAAREGEQSAGNKGSQQDPQSEGEGAQGESAEGDQQERGQGEEGEGEQGEGQSPQEQSPDGAMSPEQGDPGAGDSSSDQQGTPEADQAKKPQDKQGDSGEAAGSDEENSEAPSEGQDNSESDSESSQGGDRSGGGKQGGGQQADADGKGAAGDHQAADDGGGQASETGEGETGEQAGNQKQADGKTGESGENQPGDGSKQTENAGNRQGGEKPVAGEGGEQGAEPSEGQPAEPSDQQPSESQPQPGEASSFDSQSPAGEPGGTGGNVSSPPPGGELQSGDEANLDYARKQTDLILNRLEDQLKKKQVDKNLLEKLGWSEDELRRFVARWKNLKSKTDDTPGSEDNQELNDALRSLGLNPNRRTGYRAKITKDKLRDLHDAYRGRVPLEYQDQVNRYIKGTSTATE